MSDLCDIYGGNCGICMIAAPYPYCCRSCNYNDKEDQNG